MVARKRSSFLLLIAMLFGGLFATQAARPAVAQSTPNQIVDAFETPLVTGFDGPVQIGYFQVNGGGGTTLTYTTTATLPASVPNSSPGNKALKLDIMVNNWAVFIHGFQNGAVDDWVSQDWSAYAGFGFWFYGGNTGSTMFIDIIDNRPPGSTTDNAERYSLTFFDDFSGWQYLEFPFEDFTRKDIGNGAPNDGFTLSSVHGWALGSVDTDNMLRSFYIDDVAVYGVAPIRPAQVGFALNNYKATEGRVIRPVITLSKVLTETVTINYATTNGLATPWVDYTPTSGSVTFEPGQLSKILAVQTADDFKYEGDENFVIELSSPTGNVELGSAQSRLTIADDEGADANLLDDYEGSLSLYNVNRNARISRQVIAPGSTYALPDQQGPEGILEARPASPQAYAFGRRFPDGVDWSGKTGLSFWYYGRNTGQMVKTQLLDNQAAMTAPNTWKLAWSDEFNGRSGAPPNPAYWTNEVGDGTAHSIPGWGNSELQYYTDGAQNAAHDGRGNLQITVKKISPSSGLMCHYGPCQYTSARLVSANKAEFAYGRIEARVRVPNGAGYWPAFWALGTDIGQVGWPQSGEIDIMEFVGREPNQIFGTIHGPGYNGGQAYGGIHNLGGPVGTGYHTYAIEWTPNDIKWFFDGIQYHQADPADVAPNQWVFNHPFFLIMNVAVGGNFGGTVGQNTVFPQAMTVDYVRVYQAADSAERYESSFRDNFRGWKQITLPFSGFTRSHSAYQPAGAPNDGLTLNDVHGLVFEVPKRGPSSVWIDQLRLTNSCPTSVTVANSSNMGAGSLRQAIADVCAGGKISFSPSLINQTITVTGELTLSKNVMITGVSGLKLSGGDSARIFVVNSKVTARISNLTLIDGYGFELGGTILNNGVLTLDRVTIKDGNVTTGGAQWWQGGAGIYNGEHATLTLLNSTVSNNVSTGPDGGGLYGFFDTLMTITNSTLSGNSGNVGGGIRSLGDTVITNSTLSGNTGAGWLGSAIFHTDGVMRILNSTITGNIGGGGEKAGVFVGTFTAGAPIASFANTIIAGNDGAQCFTAPWGAGPVSFTSGGYNLTSDTSCPTAAGDKSNIAAPLLGPLANNGGPTWTHALLSGSPAIDSASRALCPKTDQRGQPRPLGRGCDIGSYERRP